MTDIRIKEFSSVEGPTLDWFVRDIGTLDDREELATAVRVALGSNFLASAGNVLPDPDSTDRAGWWGDFQAAEIWDGWNIGCKNWLLTRAKMSDATSVEGSTLERAKQYTMEALQPFIDRLMASAMYVTSRRLNDQTIEVDAVLYRGPREEIALRFQLLWEEPEVVD